MKKMKFWISIGIYASLMIACGVLILINVPDLSRLDNTMMKHFGWGWQAVLIANIAVFLLVFLFAYFSFYKYQTVYTAETKFTAYCSQITYDRPDRFWTGLIPKHGKHFLAAFGFAFLYGMISAQVISLFEWTCISIQEEWWKGFYFVVKNHYFRIDIIVVILITLFSFFYFYYKEFRKQLNAAIELQAQKAQSEEQKPTEV